MSDWLVDRCAAREAGSQPELNDRTIWKVFEGRRARRATRLLRPLRRPPRGAGLGIEETAGRFEYNKRSVHAKVGASRRYPRLCRSHRRALGPRGFPADSPILPASRAFSRSMLCWLSRARREGGCEPRPLLGPRAPPLLRTPCLRASAIATEALQRIAVLDRVETDIRGRGPDERRAIRQERWGPLTVALHAWLRDMLTPSARRASSQRSPATPSRTGTDPHVSSMTAGSKSTPIPSSVRSARSPSIAGTLSSPAQMAEERTGCDRVLGRDLQAVRRRSAGLHRRRAHSHRQWPPRLTSKELVPCAHAEATPLKVAA